MLFFLSSLHVRFTDSAVSALPSAGRCVTRRSVPGFQPQTSRRRSIGSNQPRYSLIEVKAKVSCQRADLVFEALFQVPAEDPPVERTTAPRNITSEQLLSSAARKPHFCDSSAVNTLATEAASSN